MTSLLYSKERDYKQRFSKKFMVILNYYFEDYFQYNPEFSSCLGLNYFDDEIKDYSDEAYNLEIELNYQTKKKLRLIDPFNLSLDEHVDYLLLESMVNRAIFDHENLPQQRIVKPQLYIPVNSIYCMLYRTMSDERRVKSIIERLLKIPRLIDHAKTNLKNPPKIWTESAIEQMHSVLDFFKKLRDVEPIKRFLDNNSKMNEKFENANLKAIAVLEEYDRFLKVDLVERSHGEFCIGRQAIDFYLKNNHFIDYTSGSLNELGYELFNKTLSDMTPLSVQINPDKTTESVIEELEEQYVPAEKLMENYIQLTKRIKEFVKAHDLVSFPEKEELKVVETPEQVRGIIPFAAYFTLGPYDDSKHGQFWVTPITEKDPDKKKEMLKCGHNLHRLPSIVLHETYPGHHLQLSTAKNVLFEGNVSAIRRVVFNELFCEGWALYCEQVMGEIGFYSNEQKLMMLKNRLWRCARVIIDIELHTGRMSFDQAIAFLVGKLNMSEDFARSEVIRYSMTPTQPLSYEIGRRLINQIREKQKNEKGDKFSLKEFHNQLLSKGTLPLKIVDELVFQHEVEVTK